MFSLVFQITQRASEAQCAESANGAQYDSQGQERSASPLGNK